MNRMYFILATVGWVWAAIVAVFLVVRLCRRPESRRVQVIRGEANER